jgi:hypothetical protein
LVVAWLDAKIDPVGEVKGQQGRYDGRIGGTKRIRTHHWWREKEKYTVVAASRDSAHARGSRL